MKQFLPLNRAFICALLFTVLSLNSYSQVSITSSYGYTVNVNVTPVDIENYGGSCQWGYLYTVKLNFSITFTGSNRPAAVYSLAGTIGDGRSKSIYFNLPESPSVGTVNSSLDYRMQSDCATATPASLGYNVITINISGPGIGDRTINYTYSPAPLGIKLNEFSATANNSNVDLKWNTASENNNNYFTVERSANGTNWSDVKTVKGAGNSSATKYYEAVDESPLSGTSYYRLKQTDFDGATTYSDVKAVKFAGIAQAVSIFPVPNAGNIINFKGIKDFKNSRVALLNASGTTIFTAALTKSSIELPTVPTGVYFVRVVNTQNGETSNLRYVKI